MNLRRSTSLLFLFLIGSLFFGEFVGGQEGDDDGNSFCFEYRLNNECSQVVDDTNVPEESQEDVWALIEMQISDIRMLPADCRRPLIWFTCATVFGECGRDRNETDLDMSVCEEVNDSCGGNLLDCSEFPLSPRSGDSFPSSIPPIPVTTCLEKPGTSVTCCPKPFTLSSIDGECSTSCPPQFYNGQEGLLIANYVFFFFSLVVLILSFIPYLFIPHLRVFPKYALAISMFYMLCFSINLNWGLFVGVELYVCGSERESGSFTDFLESSRCTIQQAFWSFCTFSSFYWFALTNIFLHNLVHQNNPPHFKKFFALFASLTHTDDPKHHRNELIVHAVCFAFSTTITLICILCSYFTDNSVSAIPAFYCTYRADGAGWVFWSFYVLIYSSILALYFMTLYALIRKGWVLLRFHVRIVLFFGISVIQFLIFGLTAFYFRTGIDDWPTFQVEYAQCVASSPREAGRDCVLEDDGNFWWFVFVTMAGSLWPGLWGIIGFLSTETALR